jgi:elongation factor G
MGELHLEILVDRLRREFGVEVNTGNPSVVFRETIRGTQTVSEVFEKSLDEEKKQNLYAKVTLTLSPLPREAGRSYEDARSPENLELNPTSDREKEELRQGALEALEAGPVDGYPVQDVHIRLDAVEVRPGETTPIALRVAAGNAVRTALREAQPVTLSPLMTLEVVAPEAMTGSVVGDLSSRGARIEGVDSEPGRGIVRALVPLTKMFGYSTALRSLTEGRGTFSMRFARFDALD